MPGDGGGGLWDYAVALYARPGVAEACLALQDDHGVDVPCLLFAAWAGAARGIALDAASAAEAVALTAGWQRAVVAPLRDVRRRLKDAPQSHPAGAEVLRGQVKAAELEAERIELAALGAFGAALTAGDAGPALAARNLAVMAGLYGAAAVAAPALGVVARALD